VCKHTFVEVVIPLKSKYNMNNTNMTEQHPILQDLHWRYATKQFDASKKIEAKNITILADVVRLAPSSYGLQPLKLLIITDPSIRTRLQEASYNQSQLTTASHIFVICANENVTEKHIDYHIDNTLTIRGGDETKLQHYGEFLKKSMSKLSAEEQLNWTSKQAYIALGHLLHACAQLRIDATPMEGFEPDKYIDILQLNSKKLKPILTIPLGYRSENDHHQNSAKVRIPAADFIDWY